MEFEYDPAKSASNREKHGIDFEEARRLWLDEHRIVVPTRWVEEGRLLAIGRIGRSLWTAVFVYRPDRIRLISVRRSRREEVMKYEENLRG